MTIEKAKADKREARKKRGQRPPNQQRNTRGRGFGGRYNPNRSQHHSGRNYFSGNQGNYSNYGNRGYSGSNGRGFQGRGYRPHGNGGRGGRFIPRGGSGRGPYQPRAPGRGPPHQNFHYGRAPHTNPIRDDRAAESHYIEYDQNPFYDESAIQYPEQHEQHEMHHFDSFQHEHHHDPSYQAPPAAEYEGYHYDEHDYSNEGYHW